MDGAFVGGDSDGDGIADDDEGAREGTDTDGDGTPDYLDEDSDGDGIADAIEAGDDRLETPPRDADADGIPDFRDDDSDGNGILDRDEADGDADGDGRPDFADQDDDNDRVPDSVELAGGADLDTDGDGLVDFKDPDSDDDTILDGDERDVDTDADGIPDIADLDSDADGVSDRDEAGDAELSTPPVDTDMDGIPDFRDPDSDNDGVSDLDERLGGTSRTDADSDGDGVSDLIELAAGTDPLSSDDSPRTRGDFVFVVPFEEPPMPERDTLEFRTSIQFADVYFLLDTTGSMSGEISAMRSAVRDIVTDLICEDYGEACMGDEMCTRGVCSLEGRCIEDPGEGACVASVFTGVGTYEGNRNTYRNRLGVQADPALTRDRIPGSADGSGADESLFQSVACVADPSACSSARCEAAGIGCPGYREDAVRILVTITDERDECSCGSVDSASAAGSRLQAAGITFVGVDADSGHEPADHLRAIARESDSYAADGTTPLVFDGDEAAVRTAVTGAINEIVNGVPIEATIEAADEPDDDGDALRFIDYLETNTSGVGACTAGLEVADGDGDGHPDTFVAITPGTDVCWDVVPVMNDFQEPALEPLVYRARLTVRGDGSALDDRLVYFLVPPRIEVPMGPM